MTLSIEQRAELKRQAQQHLARQHFADYFPLANPTYYHMAHTKYISHYLNRIANGEQINLLIELPPRHGKSALITETFPSYYLMKNPEKKVISTAYSDSLARKFGRLNRNKFREHGVALFDADIADDNSSSGNWSTADGGGMISTGIMGSLTGEGADLMIIDDPVKNKHEAYSKTYRDRVWDEWEATLSTRLHDGASVIVVQTRWHEDDLTGRLLENKGRKWVRIRIPAIAEEDDLIGREVGTALAPQLGYDEEWARDKKTEVGSMTWNALYQQRPTSETGTIFKREWIQYYDTLPSRVNYYSISWDLAVKDGEDNDYSVGQCWAVVGADRYLVDQVRAKLNFTDMIKTVRAFKNKHRKAREIIIEDKANGPAVIDALKREIPGIIPFNPRGSKEERALSASVLFEAGNVFIPKNAPWIHDYVEELVGFPGYRWDDSVDSTTQFIIRSLESRPARSFSNNAW